MSILKALTLMTAAVCAWASAGAETNLGHWSVAFTHDKSSIYASTFNDSGAVLGEWCSFSTKSCTWMMGTDTGCKTEHVYPVLANSDQGAAHLDLICRGPIAGTGYGNTYAYAFSTVADLQAAMKKGLIVGIAAPMKQDQFRVYRFNLDGAMAASQQAEAQFFKALNERKTRSAANLGAPTEAL